MDPADVEKITAQLEDEHRMRDELREAINALEKNVRTMTGILNRVHGTPTSKFPELIATVQPILHTAQKDIAALAALVKPNEFWRVKDMWAKHLQSAIFVVAFCEWLRSGTLASIGQVASELGIQPEWSDRFFVSSEDYLHGLITLTNELSRLALNAVIMKDYELPPKIYVFVKDLHAGFSLLNLKNDPLRRRFDSIKYDVKRIEEVVYDISLRQLKNEPITDTTA